MIKITEGGELEAAVLVLDEGISMLLLKLFSILLVLVKDWLVNDLPESGNLSYLSLNVW